MILKYHHGYHEHRHEHNLPPHHDHHSSSSSWCLDVQICNVICDTSWWHVCLACWRLLCPPNPPHSHWQITVEESESYNESPPKKGEKGCLFGWITRYQIVSNSRFFSVSSYICIFPFSYHPYKWRPHGCSGRHTSCNDYTTFSQSTVTTMEGGLTIEETKVESIK